MDRASILIQQVCQGQELWEGALDDRKDLLPRIAIGHVLDIQEDDHLGWQRLLNHLRHLDIGSVQSLNELTGR